MSMPSSRRTSTGFATGVLSLRGLMAVTVATAHTLAFTIPADYSGSVLDQPGILSAVARLVGPTINVPLMFFVISGLAIARSFDRKQDQGGDLRGYVIFVVRRGLRIYPAYIVATVGVLALAWMFLMGRPPLDRALYPATGYDFVPDWLNGQVFNPLKARTVIGNFATVSWSMNLVVWSLYVEICAIPLLPLFHRIARQKNLLVDLAMLTALVMVALALWKTLAVRYLFAFYLGMVVQTRGQDCARYLARQAGGSVRAMAWAWLVVVATCLLPPEAQSVLLIQSLAAFAIVSLIVWSGDAHPFRLLEHRWLQWNGRMSYSFYLWHYTILTVTAHTLYATAVPVTVPQRLAAFAGIELFTVATALALAQLTYTWVEEPGIRLGQRLERWARAAGAAPLHAGFASRAVSPQGAD